VGSEAIQFDRPTVGVVSPPWASEDRHRNLSLLVGSSERDSKGRGHGVVLIPDSWMFEEAVDALASARPTFGTE